MVTGVPRQPDYSVKSSEKYLDDKKQVKYRSTLIGVAWRNTDERGEERINVKLHAFPVTGELVLWKYEPYQEARGPRLVEAEA